MPVEIIEYNEVGSVMCKDVIRRYGRANIRVQYKDWDLISLGQAENMKLKDRCPVFSKPKAQEPV